MTAARRFGIVDFLLLLLIVAGAAGARCWYLKHCAGNGTTEGPLQVQDASPVLEVDKEMQGRQPPTELDALVENLKKDHWYGSLAPYAAAEEQTAHASPGYPWLLGWLAQAPKVKDYDVPQFQQTVRWIQCGLGALTAGLYFLFARRAFRSRLVALLAGLFCAVYPFWIIDTAEISDGVLASCALAGCLFLGVQAGESGGALTSLLYGLVLAGLALVRAALWPFSIVGLLWFLRRSRTVPHGWLCGLVAFLGFGIGMAPWAMRNWQVFHEPVPIVNSAGLHVWMGNNPTATGGPQTEKQMLEALVQARQSEAGEGETITTEQVAKQLADQSPSARYLEFGKAGLNEIKRDPTRFIERRLWAGLYFFFGERFFKEGHQLWRSDSENPEIPVPWFARSYRGILYGALLAMLLLGMLGWRWTYGWRHLAQPSALAVIWIPLPYILSHAESLAGPRLPLDGVLLSYAAFALVCLIPGQARALFRGPQAEGAPGTEPAAAAPAATPKPEKRGGLPAPRNPFG